MSARPSAGPATTAPAPATSAPAPATSAPKPATSAPGPTTSAPGPTTSAPRPTTSYPYSPSTTPRPSSSSTTSRPSSSSTTPYPSSSSTTSHPSSSSTTSRPYSSSTTSGHSSSTTSRKSSTTTPQTSTSYKAPPPPTTPTQQPDIVTITVNPSSPGTSWGTIPISSTLTSVFSTELVSTDAAGLEITTTIQSTYVIIPTVGSSSTKSNNTGPIVGGAVGGVAALVAALLVLFFCLRRRGGRGGNVDSERVVQDSDLHEIAGAEATPFEYVPPATSLSGPTSPTFSDGSMRQYRDSQALLGRSGLEGAGAASGTSGSYYASTPSDDPSGQGRSTSHGSAGLGPVFPVGQPLQPSRLQYPRQPEASRRKGVVLGLASAPEQGEGNVESEFIQHQDGGRIADSDPVPPSRPPQEIPPSYESIPGNAK